MVIKFFTLKSDVFGMFASILCLIHCLITPFIFIAQTCMASCCASSPLWWRNIDYFFVLISFFAVYSSTSKSNFLYIKYLLWLVWTILFLFIVNKSINIFFIPDSLVYVVAISLSAIHFYNLKFCKCQKDECCTI